MSWSLCRVTECLNEVPRKGMVCDRCAPDTPVVPFTEDGKPLTASQVADLKRSTNR